MISYFHDQRETMKLPKGWKVKAYVIAGHKMWGVYKGEERIDGYSRGEGCMTKEEVEEVVYRKLENYIYKQSLTLIQIGTCVIFNSLLVYRYNLYRIINGVGTCDNEQYHLPVSYQGAGGFVSKAFGVFS